MSSQSKVVIEGDFDKFEFAEARMAKGMSNVKHFVLEVNNASVSDILRDASRVRVTIEKI